MKIADILRRLADKVEQEDARDHNPVPELSGTAAGDQIEAPKNSDAAEGDDNFVPPLQLKLELLKRAVGVDNVYDDQRADQVTGDDSEDEIAIMQRRAGIVPVMMAVDDEPFDD